ncbi:hypothetical protein QUF90_02835 [Desulfococcaceae bacterium HSG9]|nr:hypothetical protein [Desulfococcaceae bacterium HSG9]
MHFGSCLYTGFFHEAMKTETLSAAWHDRLLLKITNHEDSTLAILEKAQTL